MEKFTNNNMIEDPSKFFELLQQKKDYNINYFKQGNNYINKQNEKHIPNLKYNIEISIPKNVGTKNKKYNSNIFRNKQNCVNLNYEIKDYFNKGFNDKQKKKNTKIKLRNKNGSSKFIKSNEFLNHLEYNTNNILDSKKYKKIQNSGLEFTLKTSAELNKINKNKFPYFLILIVIS